MLDINFKIELVKMNKLIDEKLKSQKTQMFELTKQTLQLRESIFKKSQNCN